MSKNDVVPETALVLRTSNADGTSHSGFRWPDTIGAEVTCPDWEPVAKCGNGLHGLLDGWGDYSLLSDALDARWQVVEIERSSAVEINGKVKFPKCVLRYSGSMAGALTMMSDYQIKILLASTLYKNDASDKDSAQIGSSGYYARIGSSGYYARIGSSGDSAQIGSSGDSAQIGSSGDSAQIGSSGYYARIGSSGDYARIGSSGDSARIGSSGDSAQIGSSGYYARIGSSGDSAQIGSSGYSAQIGSSGDYARIGSSGDSARIGSSGDSAQIGSSGDYAQIEATGLNAVIACAGYNATASAGEGGCFCLAWHDGTRPRMTIGYVGEDGIDANVAYRCDDAGRLVRA